jgi:hypothetical protein
LKNAGGAAGGMVEVEENLAQLQEQILAGIQQGTQQGTFSSTVHKYCIPLQCTVLKY